MDCVRKSPVRKTVTPSSVNKNREIMFEPRANLQQWQCQPVLCSMMLDKAARNHSATRRINLLAIAKHLHTMTIAETRPRFCRERPAPYILLNTPTACGHPSLARVSRTDVLVNRPCFSQYRPVKKFRLCSSGEPDLACVASWNPVSHSPRRYRIETKSAMFFAGGQSRRIIADLMSSSE